MGGTDLSLAQSELFILSGGRLTVDAAGGSATMNIGQEANANGFVQVSGTGSLLEVEGGSGSVINVGLRGTGALEVMSEGRGHF